MLDKEFEQLLHKHKVTHWNPCTEQCEIGICDQSQTEECCPTIHIPIVQTPTPSGNFLKSEFVKDNKGDSYYVDIAGNSILLEKITEIKNIVDGHSIGEYFNEEGGSTTINETVTEIQNLKLIGTLLSFDYKDENGNINNKSVELSKLLGSVRATQRPTGVNYDLKPYKIIINNEFDLTPEILPDPILNPGLIIEIRNFRTSIMSLSLPVYSGPFNTLTTLQPYGSNSYNNPTSIRIISNGSIWIILSQW